MINNKRQQEIYDSLCQTVDDGENYGEVKRPLVGTMFETIKAFMNTQGYEIGYDICNIMINPSDENEAIFKCVYYTTRSAEDSYYRKIKFV